MCIRDSGYPVHRHLATGRGDDQTAHDDGCRRRVVPRPTQDRTDACLELVTAKRLDEVVVGARFERFDDVGLAVVAGDHEHRRLQRKVAPDPLEHLSLIHISSGRWR